MAAGPDSNGFPTTRMTAAQRIALASNTATNCPRRTRISVCATMASPYGRLSRTTIIPMNTFCLAKMQSATFPLPGIGVEVVDEEGNAIADGGGYLTLTTPWPAMLRASTATPSATATPTGAGSTVGTSPATAPRSTTTQRIKNFSHFVGLMAINANGNTLRLFFPQLALNDFAMHLLDLAVALQTGFDDISSCDGGTRVRVRKDQMGMMTGNACCSDIKSFFKERLSMHAIGVIFLKRDLRGFFVG